MLTSSFLVTLLVLGGSQIDAAVKLSNYVTQCSIKDPKLNECITTQSKALLPHLITGVKEWGILPMDPLLIPHIILQNAKSNPNGFSLNGTESSHYGWKTMNFKSVKFNPENYKIEINANIPFYNLQSQYEVSGQIILLPIQGHGFMNISFVNAEIIETLSCEPEIRGGKTYLKITDTTSDLSLKRIIFNLENLFGNKQLSDAMNEVLTENSLEVFKDFKEPIENLFSGIVEGILARMFSKVPLNELFKDVV